MPEIITLRFTPTLDTSIYADGDLLFDTVELSTLFKNYSGYIADVTVNDKADQKSGIDLVFLKENRDAGTINSTPTLTDDHGDDVIGLIPVTAGAISADGDWSDVGGASIASKPGENIGFEAGMTGLYCFGVVRGATPTFAAASLVITVKIHLLAP